MRLGADPNQLEVLARSCRAAARQLAATTGRLDRRIAEVAWSGPRARLRVHELRAQLARVTDRAGAGLLAGSRRLDDEATAQRLASVAPAPSDTIRFDATGDGRWVWRTGAHDAATVVVLLPGVGSDLGDAARLHGDAESLRAVLAVELDRRGLDPDDAAVVSWLGYDPPDLLPGGLDPRPARSGAAQLTVDVGALRSGGAGRVVVVGHSYGGLVASLAAASGLAADDVVLLGAPGVGHGVTARSGGPRRWAAAAAGDPISLLARLGLVHGADPLAGATRLPTSRSGHSSYLGDPVLLRALGGVVLGGGARSTVLS